MKQRYEATYEALKIIEEFQAIGKLYGIKTFAER